MKQDQFTPNPNPAPAHAASHTPGPFIARQESAATFTVEKINGNLRSILCRLHAEHLCEEHGGTIKGNAILFAAAPDLLAALRGLAGCHDSGYEICRCSKCDAARNAIAHAKGQP